MCRMVSKVLENPELYRRRKRLDESERKRRDAEIFDRLSRAPGKLDHATIVAYEVGHYHGDEDEDYCHDDEEDDVHCVRCRSVFLTAVSSRFLLEAKYE